MIWEVFTMLGALAVVAAIVALIKRRVSLLGVALILSAAASLFSFDVEVHYVRDVYNETGHVVGQELATEHFSYHPVGAVFLAVMLILVATLVFEALGVYAKEAEEVEEG